MTAVHSDLRRWLEQLNQLVAEQRARGIEATPQMVRDSLAGLTSTFVTDAPSIARITDAALPANGARPAITVRLYDPDPQRKTPVCLFFHGGGHMAGSVDVYDPIARKLAQCSNQLVVSVDYRLAPETPFPGGLNDCLQAAQGIWPLLDRQEVRYEKTLSLIGDSGGGTFAAAVASRLASEPEHGQTLHRQVLIYPSVDYTMSQPSIGSNGEGFLLESARIQWYFDHYFCRAEDRKAHSPLFMPVPEGTPSTLIITAGYCPLRDEGFAYAEKLRQAGVACELHNHESMIHAYLNLENLAREACEETYAQIGRFLNE